MEYFQPLGKLKAEQIKEGQEVLDKLQQLIDSNSTDEAEYVQLTNQFYTIIPTQDQSLPPINTPELLEEKKRLLQSMS